MSLSKVVLTNKTFWKLTENFVKELEEPFSYNWIYKTYEKFFKNNK